MVKQNEKIRVGIIGASPTRGWAKTAHLPALQALPDYKITAVSTTQRETAAEAARQIGDVHAFERAQDLAASKDVDLVVVAVKVPDHDRAVRAALDAGKHIYCEWPLARNVTEAQELLVMAEARGVHTAVGLQGQFDPALRYASDLVKDGYVGRVLAASVVYTSSYLLHQTTPEMAYMLERRNGANGLTIIAGHTLDAFALVAGEFETLSATLAAQYPEATVAGENKVRPFDVPDHVLVQGRLAGGAVASFHMRTSAIGGGFELTVIGTKGRLVFTSDQGAGIHMFGLPLQGSQGDAPLAELPVPDKYRLVPDALLGSPAYNVAQLYASLGATIRDGVPFPSNFVHAVRRHRMLAAIEESDRSGAQQTLTTALSS